MERGERGEYRNGVFWRMLPKIPSNTHCVLEIMLKLKFERVFI